MEDVLSQLALACAGIGPVSISRDPVRHPIGDSPCGTKERLSGCLILALAQQHVHQVAIPINGPIEVDSPTLDLQIGLVTVPAAPRASTPRNQGPSAVAERKLTLTTLIFGCWDHF